MKKIVHIAIMLVALAVLGYSAYHIFLIRKSYMEGDQLYQEVQEKAVEIDMPENETSIEYADEDEKEERNIEEKVSFPKVSIDFDYLSRINSDICGWIYLDDSEINYPVLQTSDNETYLTKSYNSQSSTFGSIFIDMRNENTFTDQNTIIYGHNMKNGSMFGGLKKFQQKSYYQQHKYIYIFNKEKIYRYQVCSIYITTAGSEIYATEFNENNEWKLYEKMILNHSMIDTKVSLAEEDKIITLSTCQGVHTDNRFVVQAKLVAEEDFY